jgi:hypothetical protein
VEDPGLPFNCTILIDADVKLGHAYVEVSGARIDVGEQARIALVRAALGLDRDSSEQEFGEHAEVAQINTLEQHEHPDLSEAPLQDDPLAPSSDEVKPE